MDIIDIRNMLEQKRKIFINNSVPSFLLSENSKDLLLASAVDFIICASIKMEMYIKASNSKENCDKNLFNEMKYLKGDFLYKRLEELDISGPIGLLRYVMAKKVNANEFLTENSFAIEIENLKEKFIKKDTEYFTRYFDVDKMNEVRERIILYPKQNPFRSWGPAYRYMLPFIYDNNLKRDIWNAIEVVRDRLLQDLRLEKNWICINSQGWQNQARSYFGFEGPSNFGSDMAAIMLHPEEIPDHKNAIQIACYFLNGSIYAGIDAGVNVKNNYKVTNQIKPNQWVFENAYFLGSDLQSEYRLEKIFETYKKIIEKLKSRDFKNRAIELNKELLKSSSKKEIIAEGNADFSDEDSVNLYDTNNNINDSSAIKSLGRTVSVDITPNIKENEELLDRSDLVNELVKMLESNKVDPFNMAFYGDWGSGKTQIINLIKAKLNKEITETVEFDAWQYNDQEHIWAALITKIMDKCKEYPSFYWKFMFYKLKSYLENNWESIFLRFTLVWVIFGLIFLLGEDLSRSISNNWVIVYNNIMELVIWKKCILCALFAFIPDLIKLNFIKIDEIFVKCFKAPSYNQHLGFRSKIEDLTKYSLDFLTPMNKKTQIRKRLILFIDNLDRCSSNSIKQVLDSICQYIELCSCKSSNVIAVFAMDKTIILDALKHEGVPEEKRNYYLEKIVNFPLDIPSPENFDKLIIRLFGEEENDVKVILRNSYKEKKYIPRRLSNLRYSLYVSLAVYNKLLSESEIKKHLY